MLQPKRTKFRKQQKGRNRGIAQNGNLVTFGEFGIQAIGWGKISSRQIEAMRVVVKRHTKRTGQLWIRIFPDKPVTKKPLEVRMGKGKGGVDHWVAPVQPGRILLELQGVTETQAKQAFKAAIGKIDLKARFVQRMEQV